MTVREKYDQLLAQLKSFGRLAVAFSGGVDSCFLLKAAQEALDDQVQAFLVDSVFIPGDELREAIAFCSRLGIPCRILKADVLGIPEVRSNPTDRCYYCKRNLFSQMLEASAVLGFEILADGSNADDVNDYRPGMRALRELGIRSPLMEAGLTKQEIRALSKELKLPSWDKPSAACLASRIAYGEALTAGKLQTVETVESELHGLGIRQCRVRIRNGSARIEVEPADFDKVMREENRRALCRLLKDHGLQYVSLDLEGFRSGSMNPAQKKTV